MTDVAVKNLYFTPEAVQRMQAAAVVPSNEMDRQMYNIIGRKNLGSDEKWRLYEQAVLKFRNSAQEPIKITLEERKSSPQSDIRNLPNAEEPPPPQFIDLSTAFPQKLKSRGRNFMQLLWDSGRCSWNATGAVSIDGSPIKGSNIVDLVLDLMRKSSLVPRGIDLFVKLVRELNVPQSYVTNIERRRQFAEIDDNVAALAEENDNIENQPPAVSRVRTRRPPNFVLVPRNTIRPIRARKHKTNLGSLLTTEKWTKYTTTLHIRPPTEA